jgi:hypothetical protein
MKTFNPDFTSSKLNYKMINYERSIKQEVMKEEEKLIVNEKILENRVCVEFSRESLSNLFKMLSLSDGESFFVLHNVNVLKNKKLSFNQEY